MRHERFSETINVAYTMIPDDVSPDRRHHWVADYLAAMKAWEAREEQLRFIAELRRHGDLSQLTTGTGGVYVKVGGYGLMGTRCQLLPEVFKSPDDAKKRAETLEGHWTVVCVDVVRL